MAITPTSYDPKFWSTAKFRGLDLFAGDPLEDPKMVGNLLVGYFHHTAELPTHFSYQEIGKRQRKLKTKNITKILEAIETVEGQLLSMYVESVRDNDHTHAVASLGYSFDTIGRSNSIFGIHCFEEDFHVSIACHLARRITECISIDYGFATRRTGIIESTGFGLGMRIDTDPFSTKRERWIQDFRINNPRPSRVPFLDVFELNVLSDMHLSKSVAGRPFDAYVREKGRGTLERIGKANHLWCLEQKDIVRAKAELAGCGLVAMV